MKHNKSNLPVYVKKLSGFQRAKWLLVYDEAIKSGRKEIALIAANRWLERHLREKQIRARSQDTLTRVTFEVDTSQEFLVRSENGESFISAVLATTKKLADGVALTPEVLKKWADKINAELPVADVDHQFYERVLDENLADEDIKIRLRNKPGIVKAVKAMYDDGKLWLRLLVDKRYRKVMERAKGLSIEALLTKDSDGNLLDADFLGFTTIVDAQAADPEAVIV